MRGKMRGQSPKKYQESLKKSLTTGSHGESLGKDNIILKYRGELIVLHDILSWE